MGLRLGIDVGGTFTDLIMSDDLGQQVHRAKTSSTPWDPSEGVVDGIDKVCLGAGVDPSEVTEIRHGTTAGLNAVLTGSGARVGLVTTRGFRHILHVARSHTPGPLAGWIGMVKPEPPAPIELTIEARERVSARGDVLEPLDEGQLRSDLRRLAEQSIDALTVSLINSYANPVHEQRIAAIVREAFPDLPVSLSTEIMPEFREYERTLTAALNAYVAPAVGGYLDRLQSRLAERNIPARVSVLRSDGGVMSLDAARDRPVSALVSGPVGGVAGALFMAGLIGQKNILTLDVGGTSTDVALCIDGVAEISRQTTVGSYTVRAPALEVRTVGAGGGSIAHVPELTRALRVGPQSAGADPGPVAYGRGGHEPTVTDANLVLGYLPPYLLGGEMQLDLDAATKAVQRIADALQVDLLTAALGIVDVANEHMLGALRLVSVQRGYDPRQFALVAFGGAGPLHANALGALVGSWPVIVPPGPGLLCALGDLVADYRNEFSRTRICTVDRLSPDEVRGQLEELGLAARHWLDQQSILPERQMIGFELDVRYRRQGSEIPIDLDLSALTDEGLNQVTRRFDDAHRRLYGFSLQATHEIVNLRAIARSVGVPPSIPRLERGSGDATAARVGEQRIYVSGAFQVANVYARSRLLAGNLISGPAIVTEMDSTSLILPGYVAEVEDFGSLLIRPEGS